MDQRPLPITSKCRVNKAVETINRLCRLDKSELHGVPRTGFNEWRKPVTEFGTNYADWEAEIKASPDFRDMDFTNEEWTRSRVTTDEILCMILMDIKAYADNFNGLKVETIVRHGSSREGLKVTAADEFDTILLYDFEGFNFKEHLSSTNPQFFFLEVPHQLTWLKANYPKLCDAGVFEDDKDGVVKLNATALHQRVFESMIDSSVTNIITKIEEAVKHQVVPFRIRRKMNPASINITIEIEVHQPTVRRVDLNILPGILIKTDRFSEYPFFAVLKSLEEFMLWRIFPSGYEIHVFDQACADKRIRYIMTALRLIKTYCSKTKQRAFADRKAPPPFTTVLTSYTLKHIAFYLILYLIQIHNVEVTCVSEVLTYFSAFLNISLEKKLLPHFFFSNRRITEMYPRYPTHSPTRRYNLFENQSSAVLQEAMLSLNNHLLPALRFNQSTSMKVNMVTNDYKDNLSQG